MACLTVPMPQVAMFPLGSVLFPHMPLPLRVFEERYLVMLAQVLDTDAPEFGVVLIEQGHEVGGGDRRFGVGTMARIVQLTPGDDEVRLVAEGGRRFEVVEWLVEDPHPRAMVRELGELVWDDALTALRAEAERTVRRVLARAAEYNDVGWDPEVELADDPVAACWQLAAIAPLGLVDQLQLLGAPSLQELLEDVIALSTAAEPSLTMPDLDADFDAEVGRLFDEHPSGDEHDDEDGEDGSGEDDGDGSDDRR